MPAARSSRVAALIARQALEDAVNAWCGPGMRRASVRSRLVYLRVLVNLERAELATVAWHGLSRAVHHHAYELHPTADETQHLLDLVAVVITSVGVGMSRNDV